MPLSAPAKTALVISAAAAAAGTVLVLTMRKSADAASRPSSACPEQPPQPFLIRSNFLKSQAAHQAAIKYRTQNYGYFPGFGSPSDNAHPPLYYTVQTTFMGLPITINKTVAKVLACVEEQIKRECGTGYVPKALSGLRMNNTYRGGEVSNHVYGIAIDIDPQLNPCCGCVPPWSDDPKCKKVVASEYERMTMPKCWVDVFERYGFYWLGHDPQLRDLMHFEFLGDPTKV